LAYDMVYNGVEVIDIYLWSQIFDWCCTYNYYIWCQIGGGSLRIYKRDIQQKVLETVGISMEQASLCDSIPRLIIFLIMIFLHIY
jgi:hypothetical protein